MDVLFLETSDVLELHTISIQAEGGIDGVRDLSLLESALAQPKSGFGDQYLHPTIEEMGAAYLYHITTNHPFLDGNKRTALLCATAFLELNGGLLGENYRPTPDEMYQLVIDASTKKLDKSQIAVHLRKWFF